MENIKEDANNLETFELLLPPETPPSSLPLGSLSYEPPISPQNKVSREELILFYKSQFVSRFVDYDSFMEFMNTVVCNDTLDVFCKLFIDNRLNEGLFYFLTEGAPVGFSLYNSTINVKYTHSPLFDSMKDIFSKIPHFNPSTLKYKGKASEHQYMILLDRLIYYYNIYILYNSFDLNGFSNTAGIIIYTHGEYPDYDADNPDLVLTVTVPVENLFICTKSAPGCLSFDYGKLIYEDVENQDSSLWIMTNNILEKKFVNFDEVVFRDGPCERTRIRSDMSHAFCYNEDKKRGRSMEHYISPSTKQYINKLYFGDLTDYKYYVIDLEKFHQVRDLPMSVEEKLENCSIINHPFMQSRLNVDISKNGFYFYMKDIMDYCSEVLQKKNVFIYDMSCGATPGTQKLEDGTIILPPAEKIIYETYKFAIKGLGISKRNRHRKKSRRTKRRNKKSKKDNEKKTKKRIKKIN
jgi:hypothetical protein